MSAKRSKANRIRVLSIARRTRHRSSHRLAFGVITGNERLRSTVAAKSAASGNQYLCAIEKNQSGKYDVRIRAVFSRDGWTLPVYFLASSFNVAMKKLEESLQLLQKNEERLRFWGVERTDDPNLAGDLLKEFGLALDRRKDLPRKVAEVGVARERAVTSSVLASVRRVLADSLAQERFAHYSAAAGD
jgi:hypothetical protein